MECFQSQRFTGKKVKVRKNSVILDILPAMLGILGLGSNYNEEDIWMLYENTHFSVYGPNVITGLKPQANICIHPLLLSSTASHPDPEFLFSMSSLFT